MFYNLMNKHYHNVIYNLYELLQMYMFWANNEWSDIKNIYFAWLKVTFLSNYDIFIMFLQLLTERAFKMAN